MAWESSRKQGSNQIKVIPAKTSILEDLRTDGEKQLESTVNCYEQLFNLGEVVQLDSEGNVIPDMMATEDELEEEDPREPVTPVWGGAPTLHTS